jgi:SAM-dependent methyltransferase
MYASVPDIFGNFSSLGEEDPDLLRRRCDSQSLSYYGDISRFISSRVKSFETLSLLDVGPRTGVGLALLRLLHHPRAFTRLKFDPVVGIDLDPAFEAIAKREFPDIEARTGDIFDLAPKSFDIVTCSHTIEHLDDAVSFVRQLENIARKYLVLACPFEERRPLSDGHLDSIGRSFFDRVGIEDVEVYESFHFHNGMCCLAFKAI